MKEPHPTRPNDALREELVAYLDGELDSTVRMDIERRLADDHGYRHELQQLQRAWDLLDRLPRAEPGEAFTQTTVELVAVRAADDAQQEQHAAKQRGLLRWLIGGSGAVAASALGFLVMHSMLSTPNERLLHDLPVIENLDLYKHADSLDFLRKLDQAGLFPEEENPDAL